MKRRKFLHIPDTLVILAAAVFILLDTFLIPRSYQTVSPAQSTVGTTSSVSSDPVVTDTTYQDEHLSITITTYRINDTNVYAADILTDDPSLLKTAFADNTYGRNISETTSTTASENNAILAINGDFYGARNSGYVVRNGTVYRTSVYKKGQEDLLIRSDGTFEIIQETEDAAVLNEDDVAQVLSFGPALVKDGVIQVSESDEVEQSMVSNPRTAIAQISKNHYLFVVSDGRTSESEGLTLYEMAEFLESLGAVTAYNLDGGGSSTMVFNGKVINKPTTSGRSIKERSVSDIVYIGG